MPEGIKRISVATTAVFDHQNGDGDSEGSSVEQQAVSSNSVIYKE
jgi:hypothetical protein